jgi:hypothetical protein
MKHELLQMRCGLERGSGAQQVSGWQAPAYGSSWRSSINQVSRVERVVSGIHCRLLRRRGHPISSARLTITSFTPPIAEREQVSSCPATYYAILFFLRAARLPFLIAY